MLFLQNLLFICLVGGFMWQMNVSLYQAVFIRRKFGGAIEDLSQIPPNEPA